MTKRYKTDDIATYKNIINEKFPSFLDDWATFTKSIGTKPNRFNKTYIDSTTKLVHTTFSLEKWYRSQDFETDLPTFFKQ